MIVGMVVTAVIILGLRDAKKSEEKAGDFKTYDSLADFFFGEF
jgi:hypothetical protein